MANRERREVVSRALVRLVIRLNRTWRTILWALTFGCTLTAIPMITGGQKHAGVLLLATPAIVATVTLYSKWRRARVQVEVESE